MSSKQETQITPRTGLSALESLAISLEISPKEQFHDVHITKMLEAIWRADGKELRYVVDVDKFVIWDATTAQWSLATLNQHYKIIQNAYIKLQKLYNSMVEDKATAEDRFDWKRTALGVAFSKPLLHKRTKALLECIAAQPEYSLSRKIFDQNNDLVPLVAKSGVGLVFDLTTMQLRRARQEDYVLLRPTNTLGDEGLILLRYIEDPKMPWLKGTTLARVLDYLFKGEEDMKKFCQTCYGYGLRGDNPSQKFFLIPGASRTGKSTITNAMSRFLGEMCITLSESVATSGNKALSNNDKYELGRLEGKRFASIPEPQTGAVLSEGLIKVLTGESTFVSREIYGKPREIEPKAKIFMTCNDLPGISDPTNAMHNRELIIRTKAERLEKEEGNLYKVIADEETDKFIAWLILGHENWRKEGFVGPEECFGSSPEMIRVTSDLADFMTMDKENTHAWVILDKEATERVSSEDVYEAYSTWLVQRRSKKHPMNYKMFNKKFRQLASADLGMKLPEDSKGGVHWKMVRIVRGM